MNVYTTVSKKVNVQVEIEDLETGCTYCYQGKTVKACEEYSLSLFNENRPYAIRYLNVL